MKKTRNEVKGQKWWKSGRERTKRIGGSYHDCCDDEGADRVGKEAVLAAREVHDETRDNDRHTAQGITQHMQPNSLDVQTHLWQREKNATTATKATTSERYY